MAKSFNSLENALSPLESDVCAILWADKDRKLKVREIHAKLKDRRKYAVTSVAVILDRLYKLGLVHRETGTGLGGVHYLYSAKASQADFERSVLEQTVNKLVNRYGPQAVSYFNERFGKK